jgi:hypothetical protein
MIEIQDEKANSFKNQARLIYLLQATGWVLYLKFNANYLNSFGLNV